MPGRCSPQVTAAAFCCMSSACSTGAVRDVPRVPCCVQARPRLVPHTEADEAASLGQQSERASPAEAIERASAVAAETPVQWPPGASGGSQPQARAPWVRSRGKSASCMHVAGVRSHAELRSALRSLVARPPMCRVQGVHPVRGGGGGIWVRRCSAFSTSSPG